MRVAEIWRHPVKSFQGERRQEGLITVNGLEDDRSWGLRDGSNGTILTARREPRLLLASARLDGDEPVMELPTGVVLRGVSPATDEQLSAWLDRRVTLVEASNEPPSRAEFFTDATDDESDVVEYTMPAGRFVDVMAILLLTTASLRAAEALYPEGEWQVRRFRPNIVLDVEDEGFVEDTWRGKALRLGEAEIVVRAPCFRCTIITRPQPNLDRDLDIFRTLAKHHETNFGMWCSVKTPGVVRVGDTAEIVN